jgi:hypothetical protein
MPRVSAEENRHCDTRRMVSDAEWSCDRSSWVTFHLRKDIGNWKQSCTTGRSASTEYQTTFPSSVFRTPPCDLVSFYRNSKERKNWDFINIASSFIRIKVRRYQLCLFGGLGWFCIWESMISLLEVFFSFLFESRI